MIRGLRWRLRRWHAARMLFRAAQAFERHPDNGHHYLMWVAAQQLATVDNQRP